MTPAELKAELVYCNDCEHLHGNRSRHPRYWMCSKFPRREGFGFVTRNAWDKFDPYMYASDINGGACPLWTRKRTKEEPK